MTSQRQMLKSAWPVRFHFVAAQTSVFGVAKGSWTTDEPRANPEKLSKNSRKREQVGNRWKRWWSGERISTWFFFRFVRRFTIEQWANREKMTCWPLLNLARTQHEPRQTLHHKSGVFGVPKKEYFPTIKRGDFSHHKKDTYLAQ